MEKAIKWGAAVVLLYLVYRWWVGSQGASPLNIITKGGPVVGGGALVTPPRSTQTVYQTKTTQPVLSTLMKTNPGYVGTPYSPLSNAHAVGPETAIFQGVNPLRFLPVARGNPVRGSGVMN